MAFWKNLLSTFKSRRVWVIIILFVINGIASVRELIPAVAIPYIDGVLGLLGLWFGVKSKS